MSVENTVWSVKSEYDDEIVLWGVFFLLLFVLFFPSFSKVFLRVLTCLKYGTMFCCFLHFPTSSFVAQSSRLSEPPEQYDVRIFQILIPS